MRDLGYLGRIVVITALALALYPNIALAGEAYDPAVTWSVTSPAGVALSGDVVFVADNTNKRIYKYSADGTHLLTWGTAGTDPDQFGELTVIEASPQGGVYVFDRTDKSVQRFTDSGDYVSSWTLPPKSEEDGIINRNCLDMLFHKEWGLVVMCDDSRNGNNYASDHLAQLFIYSPEGVLQRSSSVHQLPECEFYHPECSDGLRPVTIFRNMTGKTFIRIGGIDVGLEWIGGEPSKVSSQAPLPGWNRNTPVGSSPYQPMSMSMSEAGDVATYSSSSGGQVHFYRLKKFQGLEAWPRSPFIQPFQKAKIAGIITDEVGALAAGAQIELQAHKLPTPGNPQGGEWTSFATVQSNANGYFQHWFWPIGGNEYRARYSESNTLISNTVQVTVNAKLEAWNPTPILTYGGWTRVHGLLKNQAGQTLPGSLVYLQVWDYAMEKWVWKATYRTTPSGYFDFWFKPYGTTHYRVGIWASAAVSNEVTKKVHKIVTFTPSTWRMDFGSTNTVTIEVTPRHPGAPVYLQKWNTAAQRWDYQRTYTMQSSSTASGSFRQEPKGWYAYRVHAPRDYDHEEDYSRIHWIKVQ